MGNGFVLTALPVVALGCSGYAVWAVYEGWREARKAKSSGRRRREHPAAIAVQTVLFLALSIALLVAGISVFGKTVRESPYVHWFNAWMNGPEELPSTSMGGFDSLPGSFEVVRSNPDHPVIGASLSYLPATDLDVVRLADRFPGLEWLHLQNTNITDDSLGTLRRFRHLKMVVLSQTSISDQALRQLAGLHDLEQLELCRTQISDEGIAVLGRLSSLRFLDLSGTKVTRRAVRKLRTRLPDCVIRYKRA